MFTDKGLENLWEYALNSMRVPTKNLLVVNNDENFQCMRIFSTLENEYIYFIRPTTQAGNDLGDLNWIRIRDAYTIKELNIYTS
jgi:hypothetical protein